MLQTLTLRHAAAVWAHAGTKTTLKPMLKEAQKIATDSLTCPKGGASCVPLLLPVGNMIQMTYAHYAFLALMNRAQMFLSCSLTSSFAITFPIYSQCAHLCTGALLNRAHHQSAVCQRKRFSPLASVNTNRFYLKRCHDTGKPFPGFADGHIHV